MITNLTGIKGHTLPLVSIPPQSQCEVCVIIPVKDEAQTLNNTLEALANQFLLTGEPLNPLQYEVIVLANNCEDNSAQIARVFGERNPCFSLHVVELNLPPAQAYIGYVRKLLMDEAYRRLISLGLQKGIIASTDGDTKVSKTWIAAILEEVSHGADAVGGRIITDPQSRGALSHRAKSCLLLEVGYRSLIAELEFYIDPAPYDPMPRHFQHFGASLAVTTEAYARCGGLPPVRTPEDEAFYQSLLRVDAKFRHSPLVQVVTSARETGRSPVGLARQLKQWSESGTDSSFEVESVSTIISRLRLRRKLRTVWRKLKQGYSLTLKDIEPLARYIGVSTNHLFFDLMQYQTFGSLFEKINEYHQNTCIQCYELVNIRTALRELRQQVSALRPKPSV